MIKTSSVEDFSSFLVWGLKSSPIEEKRKKKDLEEDTCFSSVAAVLRHVGQ